MGKFSNLIKENTKKGISKFGQIMFDKMLLIDKIIDVKGVNFIHDLKALVQIHIVSIIGNAEILEKEQEFWDEGKILENFF